MKYKSKSEYKNAVRIKNAKLKIKKKLQAMPALSESRQRARIELAANALRQMLRGVESKTSFNLYHLFVQSVPAKLSKDPAVIREQTGRGTKAWQEAFLNELSSRDIIEEAVGSGGEKFWGATETADIDLFLDNFDNGDGALLSAAVFPKDSDLDAELANINGEPVEIQRSEETIEEVDGEEDIPAGMTLQALEKVGDALSGQSSLISGLTKTTTVLSDQITALKNLIGPNVIRDAFETSSRKISESVLTSFNKLEAEFNSQKKAIKGLEGKVAEGIRLMNAAVAKMERRDLIDELAEKLTPVIKDAIVAEVSSNNASLKDSQDMLTMELSELSSKLDRYRSNAILAANVKQATEQMHKLAKELSNER